MSDQTYVQAQPNSGCTRPRPSTCRYAAAAGEPQALGGRDLASVD